MAIDGVTDERIDPKVLAALVNRFTADSADFLQAFSRKAEAKLLGLSQRLNRLERLVHLFERKVQHLEAPEGTASSSTAPAPGQPSSASVEVVPSAPAESGSSADVQERQPSESVPPAASTVEDEKYAVYRKMHRSGVPLLAIRQRLLMDALQDASLDVSVLDTFDGAAGTGAGAPARPVIPKAAVATPKASTATSKDEGETVETSEKPATADSEKDEGAEQAPPIPEPPPMVAGPSGLAQAAALLAQRRASRAEALKEGGAALSGQGKGKDKGMGKGKDKSRTQSRPSASGLVAAAVAGADQAKAEAEAASASIGETPNLASQAAQQSQPSQQSQQATAPAPVTTATTATTATTKENARTK
eukprot:TRINITY_DN11297_c0_g1_i2.p1 TRINITY_DN11297_c0_g1~~TRINITY_DN11297_c0_g1_i2.p1  ORF type:complete len:362 (-),score=119.92 TRINITY_DN11297_c0_g1_i2:279-1364(-)